MVLSRVFGIALLTALLLVACDKDEDPVDIPFKPDENQPVKPVPPPADTVKPVEPKKVRVRPKAKPKVQAGIESCCGALRIRRAKSKTSGGQAMYTQAIGICNRQAGLVKSGKTTRARGLAQVRGALLDSAPGSCL